MSGKSRKNGGLGELGLIELVRARVGRPGGGVRVGIGDDCAVLRPREGEEVVVTTDFSLEGRHFTRDRHAPASVGHRVLARGLSDLAAMGARPLGAFLSLALPRKVAADRRWVEGFLDGFLGLAERAKVTLAGGDTAESPSGHVLADVVLVGAAPRGKALLRSGARPGDELFCTGALGGAAAELEEVLSGRRGRAAGRKAGAGAQPHLFPEPRLAVGLALRERGLATACMDLSDGLSTDLAHLCAASGVAAEVELARLPVHPLAERLGPERAMDLALHGGEDYELLFTARPGARVPKKIKGVEVTRIGRVERARRGEAPVTTIGARGERAALAPGGWEHLR